MKQTYLVSIEARYLVTVDNEAEAKAFAIAAASCCGVEARGVAERVKARGTDVICCTKEE